MIFLPALKVRVSSPKLAVRRLRWRRYQAIARSAGSFYYRTQIRSQQATPKESQIKDEFGFF
ncbi:hypothetical protein QUB63_31080 [Microcoleus sp. ARI1-B5]|uniref:hypothetical protein n=1 Tax=unclassified Microcoleus TaxID=2642155 RepID=UPI002FD16135